MKKFLLLTLMVCLCTLCFAGDEKESKAADRVQAAADVLNEIQAAPDSGIPQEVLGSAECVAVVPSMLKGGFLSARSTVEGWPVAVLRRDGARRHFSR